MIISGRHVPAPEAKDARHRRRDRRRQGSARRGDRLRAKASPTCARCRACATATDKLAEAKTDPGMFDAMRKIDRAQGARPEGAVQLHRRGRGGDASCRSTRASPRSGGCSSSSSARTKPRRCATRSSPSARSTAFPGLPKDLKLPEIKTMAVVGAGTMGGGIAMSFADAGHAGEAARCLEGGARARHQAHPRQLRASASSAAASRRRRWTSAWR